MGDNQLGKTNQIGCFTLANLMITSKKVGALLG